MLKEDETIFRLRRNWERLVSLTQSDCTLKPRRLNQQILPCLDV